MIDLPIIFINDYDEDVGVTLKPVFDTLANGAGLSSSPYYAWIEESNKWERRMF